MMNQTSINTDEIEKLFQKMGSDMIDLGQAVYSALEPIFRDTAKIVKEVHTIFWDNYLKHGAIYGESQEGMLRWYRELGEVARLHREADYILQRQEMITDFKKLVEKRRGLSA